MKRSAFLLALAAVSAFSAPALAQEPELEPLPPATPDKPTAPPTVRVAPGHAPDTVYLKQGGLLRGAIVESIPSDHVTIALPTGEVRRVPWDVVERVEASPQAAPTAAPPPVAPKEGPLVKVHISGDDTVLLDRRSPGGNWVPACSAPCDEDLPLGDEYRISGPGLRSTRVFQLEGSPGGRVDLNVNPRTKTSWWVGAGVGGMGLVIDLYALYFVALGSAMMGESCGSSDYYGTAPHSCGDQRSAGQNMRNVGLVMLIPGTVAAIVGGGMMLANWRSGVTQSSSEGTAMKPLDAFRRTAEFRGPQAAAPEAPALFTPIFSGKF